MIKLLALFALLSGVCLPAVAIDQTPPPCKEGLVEVAQEVSPKFASSKFGPIGQKIYEVGYLRTQCMESAKGRWQLEGTASRVSEQGRGNSTAALIGAGVAWPLIDTPSRWSLDVTPMLRLGSEHSPHSSATVADGSVTLSGVGTLTQDAFNEPSTLFVGSLRAERSSRRFSYGLGYSGASSSGESSIFASGGVELLLGRTEFWRLRTSVAGQRFSGSGNASAIRSIVVSFRPSTDQYDHYPWAIEVWVSRGSHDYQSVLLALTFRGVQYAPRP